jgi:hypothetical protein
MSTSTAAEIAVKIKVYGAEKLKQSLDYAGTMGESFASKLSSKLTGMFAAAAVGAMVFDKIGEAMSKNMATAKQIGSLSTRFHIDPKQVHSLMMAANDAGVAVRTLLQGMKTLGTYASKAIVDPNKASVFKQMGMDMSKLSDIAKKPAASLADISQGLMRISNENDRQRVGQQLLGRQYQQMLPLIEKLGTDARARAEYLDNENAMTKEQVEMNKEVARMQSQLNNQWEKLIANLTPIALVLTGMVNTIAGMVGWVIKLGGAWEVYVKGAQHEAQSSLLTKEREIRSSIKNGTLSKEDAALLEKNGNNVEEFVYAKLRAHAKKENITFNSVTNALVSGGLTNVEVSDNEGLITDSSKQKGQRSYMETFSKEGNVRVKAAKAKAEERQRVIAEELAAKRAALKAQYDKDIEDGGDSYIDTKGLTEEEIREKKDRHIRVTHDTYTSKLKELHDSGRVRMDKAGVMTKEDFVDSGDVSKGVSDQVKLSGEAYQKDYDKWLGELKAKYAQWGQGTAAMMKGIGLDYHFNHKTGKIESGKGEQAQMRDRLIKVEDTEKLDKEAKEDKARDKQVRRAERHAKSKLKGVELAEDQLSDAKEDEQEDTEEHSKAKDKLDTSKVVLADAKKQAEDARKASEHLRFRRDVLGDKKVDEMMIQTADEQVNTAELNEKSAESDVRKRLKEEHDANMQRIKSVDAVTQAEKALIAAKEQAWLKEKKSQDDLYKDKKDYEKEHLDQKYQDMKHAGKSDIEILEEKFTDSVKAYEAEFTRAETEVAEIDARRGERQDEENMLAEQEGRMAETIEETDAEKERKKVLREGVDTARKSTVGALNALGDTWKPGQAVVSDLGKLGGGGAVQFGGANPVDEIKKTNKWLELIYREKTTRASFTGSDAVPDFGRPEAPAAPTYTASTPTR